MASLDHINKSLKKLAKFLAPLIPLAGCHMVDYLTANHWERLLSPQLQYDLLQVPKEKLQYLPSASVSFDYSGNTSSCEEWCLSSSDLPSFLQAVQDHCLPSLGVTTSIEEVLKHYDSSEVKTLQMKGIMSDKKSHEVEIMSNVIAHLAKDQRVDWIVDLGSGRGYLSSALVLQYNLNVVAIDSSKSNTTSALVRNARLLRHWEKLKETEHEIMEGKVKKKGKTRRKASNSLQKNESHTKIESEETLARLLNSGCGAHGRYIGLTRFITDDVNLVQIVKNVVDEKSYIGKESMYHATVDHVKDIDKSDSHIEKVSVVKNMITHISQNSASKHNSGPDLDLADKMEKSTIFENSQIHSNKSSENSSDGSAFISGIENAEGDPLCNKAASTQTSDVYHLGLVGLHTCGNLASNSLRLFLSNPKIDFLCNVGCCYHLIEEEFSKNVFIQKQNRIVDSSCKSIFEDSVNLLGDEECGLSGDEQCKCNLKSMGEQYLNVTQSSEYIQDKTDGASPLNQETLPLNPLHPSEIPNLAFGFPLSSTLKKEKFALGRNSRMLSCQPADRLTQGNFSGVESLYWRALLQVVLTDRLQDVSGMAQVGRIAGKCQNFPEYAKMAISKLGIPIEVSQEDLEAYHQKHLDCVRKLECFFLLRASLAPVIEGIILLDRLAFLSEQGEDVSAHLVQLFDPVTSPRCHAIIAFRNHQSYS